MKLHQKRKKAECGLFFFCLCVCVGVILLLAQLPLKLWSQVLFSKKLWSNQGSGCFGAGGPKLILHGKRGSTISLPDLLVTFRKLSPFIRRIAPPRAATEASCAKEFWKCASLLRMGDPIVTRVNPPLTPHKWTRGQMTPPTTIDRWPMPQMRAP